MCVMFDGVKQSSQLRRGEVGRGVFPRFAVSESIAKGSWGTVACSFATVTQLALA